MNSDYIKLALGALLRTFAAAAGGWVVKHGWGSDSVGTQVAGAIMVLGALTWSVAGKFWQEYGRDIVNAQLEVLKAKSLAQASKIREAGLPPVTASQVAEQSPTLTVAQVTKTIATLPPAIQAGVAQANVSKIAVLGFLILGALALPHEAMAQVKGLKPLTGNLGNDLGITNTAVGAAPSLDPQALIKKIMTLAAPDLTYAIALAANANTTSSKVRLQCLTAIQTLNAQVQGTGLKDAAGNVLSQPPEPDIFTNLEQIAEGIDSLSPTGPLFTSCAGAAGLAGMNVLAFINAVTAGTAAAAIVIPK